MFLPTHFGPKESPRQLTIKFQEHIKSLKAIIKIYKTTAPRRTELKEICLCEGLGSTPKHLSLPGCVSKGMCILPALIGNHPQLWAGEKKVGYGFPGSISGGSYHISLWKLKILLTADQWVPACFRGLNRQKLGGCQIPWGLRFLGGEDLQRDEFQLCLKGWIVVVARVDAGTLFPSFSKEVSSPTCWDLTVVMLTQWWLFSCDFLLCSVLPL